MTAYWNARSVLESHFPQHGMDYEEAGYTSRVYGARDFAKLMNIAVILAAFFLYAFVFLLGLIGILNVISTVSTQIKLRAKELAVLQSIGMPSESLRKMLSIESILCAGKALAAGLPIGIGIVLVMWGTVRISANTLKKQNIIETIRKSGL